MKDAQKETLPAPNFKKKEEKPSKKTTLLVFGQGPVIDTDTRKTPLDSTTPLGKEDVNFWSKNLAEATAVLFNHGAVGEAFVLGGKTGGKSYKSEAELIADKMRQAGVPEDKVLLEQESSDTIENIVNFLNLYDKQGELEGQMFDIMGAPYHVARLKTLLRLFAIPVRSSFVAEEILRYSARTEAGAGSLTLDSEKWDHGTLHGIEEKLDINDPKRFYGRQKGTEGRTYLDRLLKDNLFTRELLEFPEKWLWHVADIQNDKRLESILDQTEELYPRHLQSKYGIDRSTDDVASIRAKLKTIKHAGLSPETMALWEEEIKTEKDWPEPISKRLKILYEG